MSRGSLIRKYILPGVLLLLLLGIALPAAARPLVVEASRLNVRSGPGTTHSVLTQIDRGTVVMAVDSSNAWVRIILPDGTAGWISSQYTKIYLPLRYAVIDVSLLNVRSGPGTNYDITTRLSRNTAVAVLQEQSSWLLVLLPEGGQGWLSGEFTQPANFRGYVSVTASTLNLRGGPGTGFPVVEQLPLGEVLAVLARESGWLRVARLNGRLGWVSESFTAVLNSIPDEPQPSPVSPLRGKRLMIDAGHGGPDPGAIGIGGYYEKSLNLAVALELAPMLREAGASVLMSRWSDWGPSLWERVHLSNTDRADVFVSIHGNAHTQSWVSGTETYYYPWGAHSARSRFLAEQLQSQLVSTLGLRNIGVKTAGFYVISNTQMPSALVELGFLSNSGDEALLRRPETHRRSAEALFRGLENFFK
jgi:N-acetylmuramoyl-L-alanine amidase